MLILYVLEVDIFQTSPNSTDPDEASSSAALPAANTQPRYLRAGTTPQPVHLSKYLHDGMDLRRPCEPIKLGPGRCWRGSVRMTHHILLA